MSTNDPQQGGTLPPTSNSNHEVKKNHHASKGYSEVIIPACIIIIPMLLFPAVLLGVVFHYRISRAQPLFDDLQGNIGELDQDAYYVNISATTLVTIASWSSSIALSLVGFAMTLWTYSISSSLLSQSRGGHDTRLPTPFQFALILKLISGSMGSMWDFLVYTLGWKKKRSKLSPPISKAAVVLFIGIALSILVILADQWLHLATKSVIIAQVYPSESYSQSGKGLASSCINDVQLGDVSGTSYPCTVVSTALLDALTNATISYATVNNLSTTNRAELVVVDSFTFAILSDPSAAADLDYSTTTYGVSTTCKPIGQQCNLQLLMGDTATFDCSPIDFKGESLAEVGMNQYTLQFYENSNGTQNASATSFVNPFYFALAVNIDSVDEYPGSYYMPNDPNTIIPDHGLSTVLWCNVTVYDIAYSRVNSTIVKVSANPSNDTLGGMVLAPLLNVFEIDKWKESLRLAAFTNNSQAMADQFALTVSQTGIGLISGQLSPRENYEEQKRLNIIVARVPQAPLYTLVILCLLYCLFGLFLAVAALRLSRSPDVRELQARLGIPALVAEVFERDRAGNHVDTVEELFKELNGEQSQFICARRSEKGGLRFETL